MSHEQPAASDEVVVAPRGDDGFSLVETLVAMVLMSVAVIPLMIAGIVSIKASAQTRNVAKVETVLANAADRVNRAGEGCDYHEYVQAAAQSQGWEPDRVTVSYQYYVPAADSPVTLGTWVTPPVALGACPGAQRTDGLVQKVTITVTSPDNKIERTIVVVKSDV